MGVRPEMQCVGCEQLRFDSMSDCLRRDSLQLENSMDLVFNRLLAAAISAICPYDTSSCTQRNKPGMCNPVAGQCCAGAVHQQP